jgi:hypothetical protein
MQYEGYAKPEEMLQSIAAHQDGTGVSPTPGWVNLYKSFSIKAGRWPLVVSALVWLPVIGRQSARLVRVADGRNVQFANITARTRQE